MHVGRSYKVSEFLFWTRKDIPRVVTGSIGCVITSPGARTPNRTLCPIAWAIPTYEAM